MTLLQALKEKVLTLYVLTFATGIAFYSAILFARHIEHPEYILTLAIYFSSGYVFLFGYIVLKEHMTKKAASARNEAEEVDIVTFEEVRELAHYASTQGIDKEIPYQPEGSSVKNKETILSQLTALLHEWEEMRKLPDDRMSQVVLLYTELNLLTPEAITGRTLCDSLKVDEATHSIRCVTLILFLLILFNVFLKGWLQDIVEPEEGALLYVISFQRYFLDYLTPFLWGALGSCVYLLKIYSDLAESKIFNEDKLQGWGTRIMLGAILGGVVQFIYDSSVFTNTGLNLDANAIGFLTGIGVKVVYGALEKTIESLSSFMNLDAIKKERDGSQLIRRHLNEILSSLGESAEDQLKRKVIQEILSGLNDKS